MSERDYADFKSDTLLALCKKQRKLLDECERAVQAIIEDQTTGGGDDTFPIAKTLLSRLRAAQKEKADEVDR